MLLKIIYAFVFSISLTQAFNVTEYAEFVTLMAENPLFVAEFEQFVKENVEREPNYFDYTPFSPAGNVDFNCERDSDPQVATSVNKLRPQDIQVVAALGDSLTAALGADAATIFGLLLEYRGRSWSIGGKDNLEKVVTLPNLVKKFNPKVYGFNTGTTFILTSKEGKGFNSAVSGQEANHMPDQAQRLVERIKADKSIDWQNDWKLITLFIGGNDLCDFCKDKQLHAPQQYIKDIQQALDILYKDLPRSFVNLVTVLNVNEVKELNLNLVCKVLHRMTCPCAAFPESAEAEQELLFAQEQYKVLVDDLVSSGRYEREDFTVVVQPFFRDFSVPRYPDGSIDTSLFAPDCFHLSSKGQATAAIGLWNNLLQPVGKKQTTSQAGEKINCPTKEFPYFYTSRNSKPGFK